MKVENGNFALYFSNNSNPAADDHDYLQKNKPVFRKIFSPTGQLLGPRTRCQGIHADSLHQENSMVYDKTVRLRDETVFFDSDRLKTKPSYFVERNGVRQHRRLPWPDDLKIDYVASAAVDETSLAFSVAVGKGVLALYHFNRTKFERPTSVVVGRPAFIYDFPRASNLVRVQDRYWLGWIRYNRNKKNFETVLTNWKPGEAKAHDTVVDVPSDWNADLSLAAIGTHLCLAYHCLVSDQYSGRSQIITVFRDAAELLAAR